MRDALGVEVLPLRVPPCLGERPRCGGPEDGVVPAGHRVHVQLRGNDSSQRRRTHHSIGTGQ